MGSKQSLVCCLVPSALLTPIMAVMARGPRLTPQKPGSSRTGQALGLLAEGSRKGRALTIMAPTSLAPLGRGSGVQSPQVWLQGQAKAHTSAQVEGPLPLASRPAKQTSPSCLPAHPQQHPNTHSYVLHKVPMDTCCRVSEINEHFGEDAAVMKGPGGPAAEWASQQHPRSAAQRQ